MADKIVREGGFDLRYSIPVQRVDNGTFYLQGGHHRLEALRLLGYTEIPVIYDPVAPLFPAEALPVFFGGTRNPNYLNRFPTK